MKISIITVSFNSAATIEETIESVISQTQCDLEYIIIDGGSTDGTPNIINKYKNKIFKIISEPDSGIYDAMNKGIKLATGEVIGILNSDDFYHDNGVLSDIAICLKDKSIEACYGDVMYVDKKNKEKQVRFWQAGEYNEKKLKSGWAVPHPAFFIRREVYNKYGLFNTDFKIAADYELMLRFLLKRIKLGYTKKTLVSMRTGGHSSANWPRRRDGWKELKNAWKINNQKLPFFFIARRIFSKIKQYFI